MYTHWGTPDVVRVDNGTEFANAIVESVFKLFGVRVRTDAVRHPQSQGSAERFNRSLRGLIWKCVTATTDWKEELDVLYPYRNCPHSLADLSPMEAVTGWQSRPLIVGDTAGACSMSEWASKLAQRTAHLREFLKMHFLPVILSRSQ